MALETTACDRGEEIFSMFLSGCTGSIWVEAVSAARGTTSFLFDANSCVVRFNSKCHPLWSDILRTGHTVADFFWNCPVVLYYQNAFKWRCSGHVLASHEA